MPYDAYEYVDFAVPVGRFGDSFDRYLLRVEEMRQSVKIVEQALNLMDLSVSLLETTSEDKEAEKAFFYKTPNLKIVAPSRSTFKYTMESLIHHFKIYTEGFLVARNEVYSAVESPKGEFGVYVVSNNTSRPERCRIKAPGFLHLQALPDLSKGVLLPDLVTLIGTMDIVFGEIDR